MRSRRPRRPELSPEQKHELTQKLLLSARVPQEMPKGFDPLRASPKDLKSFGLPPRPKDPKKAANWERLMSRPMKLVQPTFEVVERNRVPLSRRVEQSTLQKHDCYTNDCFSGAVIWDHDDDDSDYGFVYITGTWVVPNPYPGSDKDSDRFFSDAWVGLDSRDTILGGTSHNIYSHNNKCTKDIHAWFEWLPGFPIKINDFNVSPGDTVTCYVWTYTDDDGSLKGNYSIHNWNSKSYASVAFGPPDPDDVDFVGDSAGWLVQAGPIPEIGSVPFSMCGALTESAVWWDLLSADTYNMVSVDGTVEFIAELEGDTAVNVYEIT